MSAVAVGRPSRCRLFQAHQSRKPCRCQAMTVSGLTRTSALRHPAQTRTRMTQSRAQSASAILSRDRPQDQLGVGDVILANDRSPTANAKRPPDEPAPQISKCGRRIVEEAQPRDQTVVGRLRRSHRSHVGDLERDRWIVCAMPRRFEFDQRRRQIEPCATRPRYPVVTGTRHRRNGIVP